MTSVFIGRNPEFPTQILYMNYLIIKFTKNYLNTFYFRSVIGNTRGAFVNET